MTNRTLTLKGTENLSLPVHLPGTLPPNFPTPPADAPSLVEMLIFSDDITEIEGKTNLGPSQHTGFCFKVRDPDIWLCQSSPMTMAPVAPKSSSTIRPSIPKQPRPVVRRPDHVVVVAPRQDQEHNEERTSGERNDTDRSPARIAAHRGAIVGGASTPVAMINREGDPVNPTVPGPRDSRH
jgi:hypothetical protein